MGYAGKFQERERARELRAEAWTLQEIATELGVVQEHRVRLGARRRVHPQTEEPRPRRSASRTRCSVRKEAEIERCRVEAIEWVGA